MDHLIKIGHTFLNLDRVWCMVDQYQSAKEDKIVVRFGSGPDDTLTFTGREADDLRTWLNSKAINLHQISDLDARG